MARSTKYSPEVRQRAVRKKDYASQWAAIASMSSKIGCTREALRKWVRPAERDAGQRPGLTTEERQRLKQLERENRELKRANEILRKASVSPKRSSTANRGDDAFHRRASGPVRGRVDLQAAADRSIDVLRADGSASRPGLAADS